MKQSSKLLVPVINSPKAQLSLAYATKNNFTGQPVYKNAICFLHEEAARRLYAAIELIKPLELSFKIWDTYRPLAAQRKLFEHTPDPTYISSPDTGLCTHCRGIAIDLTLVDKKGNELPMGTPFDDFRSLAHHGNQAIAQEEQRNRLLLAGIMSVAGFDPYDSEWWHYQLPNVKNYPIIDETIAKTGIME
ncbi:D-alanyl-D-alanine dipeptidase [invertebrate metagenome]|uniref:D-alanyl-D-alanine dipeptidase n=1 Tax=invertebrate metagenome TaxID=1711999 RepID=A0A2H9TBG6_9ZZZZ